MTDLDEYGGIDELVFLTNQHVTSDYSDPWEAPIQKVYVPRNQMDGSKLVGAQSARGEGSFHYTISGGQQGKNTVTITDDKSNKTWTLTYVDGKLTDTAGTVLQKATTEQQTLVEQLNADWVGMNSGTIDDGSTIKTDVNDSYTDEPARARELLN